MHIIAVDDEHRALKALTGVIKEVVPLAMVHDFQSPLEALTFMEETNCEIAFLAIEMQEMNGIILATKLKQINPKINLIFVTEHPHYAKEAFELRVSGYVAKPVTTEKIVNEMENLRNPVKWKESEIYVNTFGSFELLVNEEAVYFNREKSKEMLAYLVDKRGKSASRRELASVLFQTDDYTRATQNYLSKIIKDLVNKLEEVGAGKILKRGFNSYSVDVDAFNCDLYDYEKGFLYPPIRKLFQGEYMQQYSWSEVTLAKLFLNKLK